MATPSVSDDTTPQRFTGYFDMNLEIPLKSEGLKGAVYDNRVFDDKDDPSTNLTKRAKDFNQKKGQLSTPHLTAAYVPPGPTMNDKVDVVLFLHGHKKNDALTHTNVWNYLRDPRFRLREAVSGASKRVLLVVPSLGETSAAGKLQSSADYYLTFLQSALDKLEVAGDFQSNPYFLASRKNGLELGNVILACHSGGGVPLVEIIKRATSHEARIRELWIFDALYSSWQVAPLVKWKKSAGHSLDRLVIYFRDKEDTAANSKEVKRQLGKSKNVDIRAVTEKHVDIPSTYLGPLISSAESLKAK